MSPVNRIRCSRNFQSTAGKGCRRSGPLMRKSLRDCPRVLAAASKTRRSCPSLCALVTQKCCMYQVRSVTVPSSSVVNFLIKTLVKCSSIFYSIGLHTQHHDPFFAHSKWVSSLQLAGCQAFGNCLISKGVQSRSGPQFVVWYSPRSLWPFHPPEM